MRNSQLVSPWKGMGAQGALHAPCAPTIVNHKERKVLLNNELLHGEPAKNNDKKRAAIAGSPFAFIEKNRMHLLNLYRR